MDSRKQILKKITLVFWTTLISSIIFSPLFGNLYIFIFNPVKFNSMLSLGGYDFDIKLGRFIFSYLFFMPIYISIFTSKKQLLIWLIFVFIPFFMSLVGGSKYLFWFFIFTVSGSLIGWLINLGISKFRKIKKV